MCLYVKSVKDVIIIAFHRNLTKIRKYIDYINYIYNKRYNQIFFNF